MPAKSTKTTEATEEIQNQSTEATSTEKKTIPVLSAPGKAIVKTEFGYDFENIHISKDVPMNVLADAFVHRLGNARDKDSVLAKFDRARAVINHYAISKKNIRIRERNGVISYGAEDFTIPGVGPEVFLRIIEDNFKNNTAFTRKYMGKEEGFRLSGHQSLVDTIKAVIG